MGSAFEDAKKEYLARIELEYAPPAVEPSWGSVIKKAYVATEEYATKLKVKPGVGEFVEVRNNSGCLIFPVFFLVSMIASEIIKNGDNWMKFFGTVVTFLVIVFFAIWFSKIPGRKKLFWMNKDFIRIYKVDTEINWEFVLRTDIKTVSDSDSTDHFFVIHYYDKEYQYFRSFEMNANDMNIDPEKLSFYVEHFKNCNQQVYR